MNLPDPLVSLEHCTIDWTTDRHYVADLGTPSGTFVDGRRVGTEALPLLRGMRLQVGESVFLVQNVAGRGSYLAPVLLVITAIVVLGWGWAAWRTAPDLRPMLHVEGVHIAPNTVSNTLQPPMRFVRHWGEDAATLAVREVTDHDHDGVSEVWLVTQRQRTLVVTFGGEGEGWADAEGVKWRVIGDLPAGCFPTSGIDFPNEQCGIDLYSFVNGSYRLVQQDDYVVWMPVTPGYGVDDPLVPSPKQPTPFQFGGVDPERLEAFLLARGVEEPVHYLLCENGIPGLAAQVVTETGRVRQLDFGCIDDLATDGNVPKRGFGQYRPAAIALTASGRRALIDDVTLYLSGSADGAFLTPTDRALVEHLAQPPTRRDVSRLVVNAPDGVNSAIAHTPLGPALHALASAPKSERVAAPVASAVELLGDGTVTVDPEGCAKLDITTSNWECVMTKLCVANQSFLTVTEVGCGAPRVLTEVPYAPGIFAGGDENLEVRVETVSRRGSGLVSMLSAKVSWRKYAPPPAPPQPPPAP